jgi:hypothetical protein
VVTVVDYSTLSASWDNPLSTENFIDAGNVTVPAGETWTVVCFASASARSTVANTFVRLSCATRTGSTVTKFNQGVSSGLGMRLPAVGDQQTLSTNGWRSLSAGTHDIGATLWTDQTLSGSTSSSGYTSITYLVLRQ